jgi:hypothetical protein
MVWLVHCTAQHWPRDPHHPHHPHHLKHPTITTLQDFHRDQPAGSAAADGSSLVPGGAGDPLQAGMSSVMRAYERELQAPLKNLVVGELARLLLIQVRGAWGAGWGVLWLQVS